MRGLPFWGGATTQQRGQSAGGKAVLHHKYAPEAEE
jgi:hypothetical protein